MKIIVISLMASLLSFTGSEKIATYKTDSASSSMKITGTSTMHDWEMEARNMKGLMNVDIYENSLDIKNLRLSIKVENLKSGKSAMDKNAQNALKRDQHPEIIYQLTEVQSITKKGESVYALVTRGTLSVAGKTRTMTIPLTANVSNASLDLKGSTSFKMSQFDVEPPSFMFGSVTTGDKITINFNVNYKS